MQDAKLYSKLKIRALRFESRELLLAVKMSLAQLVLLNLKLQGGQVGTKVSRVSGLRKEIPDDDIWVSAWICGLLVTGLRMRSG